MLLYAVLVTHRLPVTSCDHDDGLPPHPPSSPEPLGFARNLQVTDPTTSTLNVRWDAAEGNVREYIVIWVPVTGGGEQEVVKTPPPPVSVNVCRNSVWECVSE